MDLSGNGASHFSFEEISTFIPFSLPRLITASGIHRAVVEDNLEAVKYLVDAGESVNAKGKRCEFTPLHLAVLKRSEKILDYLLSRDDIDVDVRCGGDGTPLGIASGLGAYELVKKLIDAGANVNLTDDYDLAPLHASVSYPDICHLLIQNGAYVDAVDLSGRTPLHCTVQSKSLQTMYVLLYYNADTNVPDTNGMTPFMYALVHQITEAQGALLDYVVDFNNTPYTHYSRRGYPSTIVGMALQYGSPFVKDIMERGADLNYCDNRYDCSFLDCLNGLNDQTVFKVVWERHRCHQSIKAINLCSMFDVLETVMLGKVVQVIMVSDNFELAVDSFMRNENFYKFIKNFVTSGLEWEQLVVLTCRLLEYGYRPTLLDVQGISSEFELCELSCLLFYMDIDYRRIDYPKTKIYIRAMFDLDFDAGVLANEVVCGHYRLTSKELVSVLEYFQDSHLVNVLWLKFSDNERISEILEGLPKVPSLMELARNQARKYICKKFKVINICQFYTIMDRLAIPSTYKSIITYNRKIYDIK